jgi:RNA polymerase sigma-70 factor, ECF subfamily
VSAAAKTHRLERTIKDNADFVWRMLRRMGVPAASADDAAQEVFMVLAQKLDVVEPGRERAYLCGVAMNVAAHARRALGRSREVGVEPRALDAPDARGTPEAQMADGQARATLDRVLGTLSEPLRAVLVLHEIEELTMAEIAAALDLPPGTVASRLRRAREDFRLEAARVRAELDSSRQEAFGERA